MLLSLDSASSKTGYAIFDNNGKLIEYNLLKPPNKCKTLFSKYLFYIDRISFILRDKNIDIIVIEDQYIKFKKAYKTLLELRGIILCICFINEKFDINFLTSTQIRSILLHKGNADKIEVCKFLEKHYNIDFTNTKGNKKHDITDAIAVGLAFILKDKVDYIKTKKDKKNGKTKSKPRKTKK